MCFYSDDYCDFQNTTTPIARKPHQCDECRQFIQPGNRYTKINGKYDGSFSTTRLCAPCESVRKLVHEAELAEGCQWNESWCPIGELRSAISEHGHGYGIVEKNEEYEPAKLLRPEAAHLFPELVK